MESPVEACLACAQVFLANEADEKARQAIQLAYQELQRRAAKISDPAWRANYLEQIPAHQEVMRLWKQLSASE
jgi:hypothetical protein